MLHGAIEEAFAGVFVVQGQFQPFPLVSFTRTMTIVREGADLTLINPIRLTAAGEEALEDLGQVRHTVRIGAFHGVDEPYLKERFGAAHWKQGGQRGAVPGDHVLAEGSAPIEARVFEFPNARHQEAALILPGAGGIAITCDSLQNNTDLQEFSALSRVGTRALGLAHPAHIGAPWRRAMTVRGGPSLSEDFRRLLDLDFRHLITGHGAPLRDTAKDDLTASIQRVWKTAP